MSLSDKLSNLLDSIMLLSQIIATMISTVKFERNNLPFTIQDLLKSEFNWTMYEITTPFYAIHACILYRLCFKQHGFLKEDLIGYTHANFHHATTFDCRYIAFQISWLPYNPHRGKWSQTFCGRCISTPIVCNQYNSKAEVQRQFALIAFDCWLILYELFICGTIKKIQGI